MARYDQDFNLTEMDIDLSLDDILSEYQMESLTEAQTEYPSAPAPSPTEEQVFFRITDDIPQDSYTPDSPALSNPSDVSDVSDVSDILYSSDAQDISELPNIPDIPDVSSFWDMPDIPVPETQETAASPEKRKSSLPTEEEIRSFMEAFARGDYSDTKNESAKEPVTEPEFDNRFLMGEDYRQGPDVMMYGDAEIDSSPDEDYEPPKKVEYVSTYAPDQFSTDPEDREEADPEPDFFGRFKKRLGKKSRREKASARPQAQEPVRTETPENQEQEEPLPDTLSPDEEFAASFRDYGATPADYAEDEDYDTQREINETAEFNRREEFFPSSFKEYIFSIVTSLLYRLRGGAAGSATVQEDNEDLGPEVSAKDAMNYYGSFIKPMRLRLRISLLLLIFMGWVSLGLPVTGLLNDYRVAGLLCLAMQLTIMLLSLDVVTNGILSAARLKPGVETLAVFSCLLTSIDALLTALTDFAGAHIPLCLISSLSLVGLTAANLLTCRGMRKAIRVPAIGKNCYAVTGEMGLNKGEVTLLKSLRSGKGFVRRSEEAAPDEELFRKASVPLMILAVLLTLIIAIAKKNYTDLAFILSAVFCPAVPLTALLCYALPFFMGSVRIFSSGAGIAGWSGLCDIGQSKNLIVTDRDLFPEGSVELESVRIFANADPEQIISYAGSMLTASGCGVASCFSELMERNGCVLRKIENFEYLPGGGMKGIIDSSVILCGSSDLMQLMNVRVPFRLVDRTSVLLAVNGILYGIFNMKYSADPKVRKALVGLMRSNRHPIFAIRDFNVTPEMLRSCFDVATDGYDFPPYVERFRISEARPSEDSKVAAVICREGLGPLTHMADTGRSMYVTIRLNLLLTALCSVIGMLTVFLRLVGAGTISVGFLFWYMVLWAIPVGILSFILKA